MWTDARTKADCEPLPAGCAYEGEKRTRHELGSDGWEAWHGIATEALMEAAPHDTALWLFLELAQRVKPELMKRDQRAQPSVSAGR